MIVSASYNYFNGHEHFIASLSSIRSSVDHISVVWQSISNAGEDISIDAESALHEASELKLVDDVVHYTPNLDLPRRSMNELNKRKLGLSLAKFRSASHFLSMDADEFYRKEEFIAAKRKIEDEGWKTTSAHSFMHCQTPRWRCLDRTNVCFLCELQSDTEIGMKYFPASNVDPTRRITSHSDSHYFFKTDELAMYHMNLVREDFAQKLRNSSTENSAF